MSKVEMFQYISCCYLSDCYLSHFVSFTAFQYISCCYLSYLLHCSSYLQVRFNTSHVVIYHIDSLDAFEYTMFQYISCCYLSRSNSSLRSSKILFQYISCCYLSELISRKKKIENLVSIHLMLLFIPLASYTYKRL